MKRILASAIIGLGIVILFIYLIAIGKQLVSYLNDALFAWQHADGWMKIYLLLGSVVTVFAVGWFIKCHLLEKQKGKWDAPSIIVVSTAGAFLMTLFILAGVLFWPVVLYFLIRNITSEIG